MAARAASPPLPGSPLIADQTAVGKPMIDRLRRTQRAPRVVPVVIGVGQAAQRDGRGGWLVPKLDLVTSLQLVFQSRRLKVGSELPDTELLVRELAAFRLRRVAQNDSQDAEWRTGRHDDLVFAVALACWYADRHRPLGPEAFTTGGSELSRLMNGGMKF